MGVSAVERQGTFKRQKTNKCEKYPSSLRYLDSNSHTLEHDSHPIITRQGFPPRRAFGKFYQVCDLRFECRRIFWLISILSAGPQSYLPITFQCNLPINCLHFLQKQIFFLSFSIDLFLLFLFFSSTTYLPRYLQHIYMSHRYTFYVKYLFNLGKCILK